MEVLFSPGASHNPFEVVPLKQDHTLPVLPRMPLHAGEPRHTGLPLVLQSARPRDSTRHQRLSATAGNHGLLNAAHAMGKQAILHGVSRLRKAIRHLASWGAQDFVCSLCNGRLVMGGCSLCYLLQLKAGLYYVQH